MPIRVLFRELSSRCARPLSGLICLLLAGCAGMPSSQPLNRAERDWVLQGAGLIEPSRVDDLPTPASLLAVSEPMRAFAQRSVAGISGTSARLDALTRAMNGDDGLALRYDALATLSAEQAFIQRRANCLSYTMLLVALGREVGIDVRFNEVDVPPIWDLRDETRDGFLMYRHINARVESSVTRFLIVDVTPQEYDGNFPQRVISDRQALAQYYNNRAIERLGDGSPEAALPYALRGLSLDEEPAYLWTNLAHLYLRLGQPAAAEAAVRRGLQLDPADSSAYGTVASVYDALKQPSTAARFRRAAERAQQRNPYYHYQLARQSLERGDDLLAYQQMRRAMKLDAHDHRFFFLMGVILARLDQMDLARSSIEVAIQLSSDPQQQSRYRSKLQRLRPLS